MLELQSPTHINPHALIPVHPAVEKYLRRLTRGSDHPVLADMEALARRDNFPIIERLCGVFIEILAKAIGARRVFEFGSGYGYSAYWFAKAMGTGGKVVCTDSNAANRKQAETFLVAAGLWERIDFRTGWAQQIFAQCDESFDICYNDADKGDYPEIWELAKTRIRPGGFYIADNVLWQGRVAVDNYVDIVPGWTEAILEHNRAIFNDPEFDAFINPPRDDMLVARKKTA